MHLAHNDCGNYSKGQVGRRIKLATEKPRFKATILDKNHKHIAAATFTGKLIQQR